MAEITVVRPDVDGVDPGFVAAQAGGDHLIPDAGRSVVVLVRNDSAGALTVTVDDPNTSTPAGAKAFDPDVDVSVPAGAERAILLDRLRFVDEQGRIDLTYSGVTSLTVAALAV